MSRDNTEHAELLQRLFDAFEDERWDEFREILADDIVAHEHGEVIRGLDERLEVEQDFKENNPDASVEVEEMATSGGTVFSRGIAPGGGTHLFCAHLEDGEIVEFWTLSE